MQKKIESILNTKFPDKWIPAYSLVTFSPYIRYSEALKQGQRQERIMQEIMQMPDIENRWNDDALHQEIIQKIG